MDAEPAPTALTAPDEDTVATDVLALDQVIDRPVSTLPAASRSVATDCADWPTVIDEGVSVTEIDATATGGGAETVTATLAVTPSTWPVMVAVPAATAVAVPVAATVTTPALELDQFTPRSARIPPLPSFTTAVIRAVSPGSSESVVGERLMDAAGTSVTVTDADAERPLADAFASVFPMFIPVTAPSDVTAATVEFIVDQVTGWFGMTEPFASSTCATSWAL